MLSTRAQQSHLPLGRNPTRLTAGSAALGGMRHSFFSDNRLHRHIRHRTNGGDYYYSCCYYYYIWNHYIAKKGFASKGINMY